MRVSPTPKRRERGSSIIEFVLAFPLLLSFFFGAFDLGFYCYALISVQDAARTVALFTSSATGNGNTTAACSYLLANLAKLPNLHSVTSCNSLPLRLTLNSDVTGPDNNIAVTVTVTYQTVNLIGFYGLPSQLTITRTVEARRRS